MNHLSFVLLPYKEVTKGNNIYFVLCITPDGVGVGGSWQQEGRIDSGKILRFQEEPSPSSIVCVKVYLGR